MPRLPYGTKRCTGCRQLFAPPPEEPDAEQCFSCTHDAPSAILDDGALREYFGAAPAAPPGLGRIERKIDALVRMVSAVVKRLVPT